jgi:hypothetical protein
MEATAYKRPTISVRQRPYIFYRSIQNYILKPAMPADPPNVVNLRPQGNIADGNRVTHGWKIFVNYTLPSRQAFTIHINGNNLNLGVLTDPFLLLDTTLDPLGIDSTQYSIFNPDLDLSGIAINMYVVEQILQISPM